MFKLFKVIKIKQKLLFLFIVLSAMILAIGVREFVLIRVLVTRAERVNRVEELFFAEEMLAEKLAHFATINQGLLQAERADKLQAAYYKHQTVLKQISDQLTNYERVLNSFEQKAFSKFKMSQSMNLLKELKHIIDSKTAFIARQVYENKLAQLKNSNQNWNFAGKLHQQMRDSEANLLVLNQRLEMLHEKTRWYRLRLLDNYNKWYDNSLLFTALYLIAGLVAMLFITLLISQNITKPVLKIRKIMRQMSSGDIPPTMRSYSTDEIGETIDAVMNLRTVLQEIGTYARSVSDGDLAPDSNQQSLIQSGSWGSSWIAMKEYLKQLKEKQTQQDKINEQQKWVSSGIAMFADILRDSSSNLEQMSREVISQIINYTAINQGAVFLIDTHEEKQVLELKAAFAYNRERIRKKHIDLGEGLIGACAIEGKTNYLRKIPENYLDLTSGLGEKPPRELLLIPLKHGDNVQGVLELASFEPFEPFVIEFLEELAGDIAATIVTSNVSARTNRLLSDYQKQSKELADREQQTRSNYEDLLVEQEAAIEDKFVVQRYSKILRETFKYMIIDHNGIITKANKHFAAGLAKGDSEKLIGTEFAQLWKNEQEYKETIERLKTEPYIKGRFRLLDSNGNEQAETLILTQIETSESDSKYIIMIGYN